MPHERSALRQAFLSQIGVVYRDSSRDSSDCRKESVLRCENHALRREVYGEARNSTLAEDSGNHARDGGFRYLPLERRSIHSFLILFLDLFADLQSRLSMLL